MKNSTRKRLGVVILVASLLAIPALYLSGIPLLSVTSWQTESIGGGAFVAGEAFHVHWALLVVCVAGFLVCFAIILPQPRPARLSKS
jgi:hypothetical protein